MDASASTGDDDDDDEDDDDDDDDLSPCGGVRLASMLLFRLVTFYVHTEGSGESKRSQEYTHKYCLFLARLQAARVWSLLKSPESDSKISSIRIPALDLLAYVFDCCNDAHVATMCGCFCVFVYRHHRGVL